MTWPNEIDGDDLDDAAIKDAISSFVAVHARDWQRRVRNAMFAQVGPQVMELRRRNKAVDTKKLIHRAWLDQQSAFPALDFDS